MSDSSSASPTLSTGMIVGGVFVGAVLLLAILVIIRLYIALQKQKKQAKNGKNLVASIGSRDTLILSRPDHTNGSGGKDLENGVGVSTLITSGGGRKDLETANKGHEFQRPVAKTVNVPKQQQQQQASLAMEEVGGSVKSHNKNISSLVNGNAIVTPLSRSNSSSSITHHGSGTHINSTQAAGNALLLQRSNSKSNGKLFPNVVGNGMEKVSLSRSGSLSIIKAPASKNTDSDSVTVEGRGSAVTVAMGAQRSNSHHRVGSSRLDKLAQDVEGGKSSHLVQHHQSDSPTSTADYAIAISYVGIDKAVEAVMKLDLVEMAQTLNSMKDMEKARSIYQKLPQELKDALIDVLNDQMVE